MATLLTIDMVTQEALAVLHNELPFTRRINRDYDSEFGVKGAKIGDTIRVRKPIQYTVRTGLARVPSTVTEEYVNVAMDFIRGIDFDFTDTEMYLKVDDFSRRYIMPGIKRLAAEMEKLGLNKVMAKVYNYVGTFNAAISQTFVMAANTKLTENLAPMGDRYLLVNPTSNATLVVALSSLFQSSSKISAQYEEGVMGVAFGFEFLVSNLMRTQTVGEFAGTVLSNGATQTGASIAINGFTNATGTVKAGSIVKFTGGAAGDVNMVNPETKTDMGVAQQFVVTADATVAGNAATLVLSPAIVTSGALQNVTIAVPDDSTVTWVNVGTTLGLVYRENLAFHKDAFTFVMGEYQLPRGVDEASVQEIDGFKVRMVRYFDGANGQMNTRLDVIFGYEALYPQWAVRLASA